MDCQIRLNRLESAVRDRAPPIVSRSSRDGRHATDVQVATQRPIRVPRVLLAFLKEERQMKALLAPVIVVLALVAAIPLSAHHSWPVNTSRLVTVKGTVLEFAWENPHPMITLEVRTDGNPE